MTVVRANASHYAELGARILRTHPGTVDIRFRDGAPFDFRSIGAFGSSGELLGEVDSFPLASPDFEQTRAAVLRLVEGGKGA